MTSKDLEVRALRVESMKLVQQAEQVLGDLLTHQRNLEQFLDKIRSGPSDRAAHEVEPR